MQKLQKQGEWKYGVYIPASGEEARQIWVNRRDHSKQICLAAKETCECCSNGAGLYAGRVHHRNGNKQDFGHQNLIWLCECCYIQVNGYNRSTGEITISMLKAELT